MPPRQPFPKGLSRRIQSQAELRSAILDLTIPTHKPRWRRSKPNRRRRDLSRHPGPLPFARRSYLQQIVVTLMTQALGFSFKCFHETAAKMELCCLLLGGLHHEYCRTQFLVGQELTSLSLVENICQISPVPSRRQQEHNRFQEADGRSRTTGSKSRNRTPDWRDRGAMARR